MKTCENCFWYGDCHESGKRCEYYDPVEGDENIVIREYRKDLDERHEEYQELVREQQEG